MGLNQESGTPILPEAKHPSRLILCAVLPQSRAEPIMKERPQLVTIIAWILILKGALFLVGRLSLIGNPFLAESMERAHLPVAMQYLESFLGYAVAIVAGVYLLRGENWARWLYVYWAGLSFALALMNDGLQIRPFVFLLLNGVLIFLLMRPPAADFFGRKPTGRFLG